MLLVAFRASNKCPSVESTADKLYPVLTQVDTKESLLWHLHHMINAGHRYGNIEKALGRGVCLVLGKEVSETM